MSKKKQPPACESCFDVAYRFFCKWGNEAHMRPLQKKEEIYRIAVARHQHQRCWEK